MVDFWTLVRQRADEALASGAMHSFESEMRYLKDGGVRFVVRRATRFPPGETAAGRGPGAPALPRNPFLEPEPALVVAQVGERHLALLNKFNVLREHLLLVTREFVDQRTLLDEGDFAALSLCMKDADVLAFYNGGPAAGASQPHKHLQLVTLPLSPRVDIPIEAALGPHGARLPFRHAFAWLAPGDSARPALLAGTYRDLLNAAGLPAARWESEPYNLVVTHRWMLLVPRTQDRFEGISINALAFAGSLFVRDERQLAALEAAGPMAALKSVTLAV